MLNWKSPKLAYEVEGWFAPKTISGLHIYLNEGTDAFGCPVRFIFFGCSGHGAKPSEIDKLRRKENTLME